ncbi:DUF1697 domain-containing protein [Mangrovivirga sp. M17]|uniref:DUF1697 domain-containing protein n=1 Tax=Mangrovivirga halotolerans TaxID=2993936 RepID=A0ABT3RMP7_9BACT|nr:DUF1697 domain-containing protein [Mangrovivirga halotolerans]MCX2743029.1 DUF1697 domain-containing protein [Mangrovivirga halotolerans]
MEKKICLLRGINVSGKNKIKMKDLRDHLESSGLQNVSTYIQSGNIVFETRKKDSSNIAEDIRSLISDKYGYDVSCLVIEPEKLEKILAGLPEIIEDGRSSKKIYFMILDALPSEDRLSLLKDPKAYEPERFKIIDDVIYYSIPDHISPGKLNTNLFENKLKVTGTTRNKNTIEKLLDMV